MRKEDAGMLKRLKFMFSLFDKIVVGILFVTAIYIPVFYGWNTVLYPEILWHILFLSIICMLGSVLLPLERCPAIPYCFAIFYTLFISMW